VEAEDRDKLGASGTAKTIREWKRREFKENSKTAIWELEKHSTTYGGRPVPRTVVLQAPGAAVGAHEPVSEAELESLRRSAQRGCPYGTEGWVKQAAAALGLESTLRPRGRPAKTLCREEQPEPRLFF
jgi:hypothetical protein